MNAGEGDNTATPFIGDDAGVDGSLAYEGVAAIDVFGQRRISTVGCGPAYYQRFEKDFLVAHCIRIVRFYTGTVSRTSKSSRCVVEWPTSVPIEATIVASRPAVLSGELSLQDDINLPVASTAPDGLWLSITLNIAIGGRMTQYQGEYQEPREIAKNQEGRLMLSLW